MGDLAELTVKVLNSKLGPRIVKSPEETTLILLTKVCLKSDEANSLYEDNNPAGRRGQTHNIINTSYNNSVYVLSAASKVCSVVSANVALEISLLLMEFDKAILTMQLIFLE